MLSSDKMTIRMFKRNQEQHHYQHVSSTDDDDDDEENVTDYDYTNDTHENCKLMHLTPKSTERIPYEYQYQHAIPVTATKTSKMFRCFLFSFSLAISFVIVSQFCIALYYSDPSRIGEDKHTYIYPHKHTIITFSII